MQLNPPSRHDVQYLVGHLNAAREIVSIADGLYKSGLIREETVESLVDVQGELGRFLAFFTDGDGYGLAKPEAVDEMMDIEYQACELLFNISRDAIAAENSVSS